MCVFFSLADIVPDRSYRSDAEIMLLVHFHGLI